MSILINVHVVQAITISVFLFLLIMQNDDWNKKNYQIITVTISTIVFQTLKKGNTYKILHLYRSR